MKVCVVTETYWPELNGVANTLHHLVRGLVKLNYDIQLVCPFHLQRKDVIAYPRVSLSICGSLQLPGYHSVNVGFPSKALLRKLWRESKPDVVYVATEGPLGWMAIKLCNSMRIPVVSGFHTNFHAYSRYYGLRPLEPIIRKYLVSIHNKTNRTIVPSPGQAAMVRSMGIDNVAIMGRGVDTTLFSPIKRNDELRASWGANEYTRVMICVGRLAQEKNLDLAIATYYRMKREHHDVMLVLVGDGPMLSRLMQEHTDIIFAGAQQGERLAQYYASADVFLFPSITETFGNVVLEAMASGLGVVAYNYAAAKKHIINNQTGMLAPLNNGKAFLNAADTLMRHSFLLKKVRTNAVSQVQAYSWDAVTKRFIELLGLPQPLETDEIAMINEERLFAN